jgi:hypothetical protein
VPPWKKVGNKQGNFTLAAETVFRLYLTFCCSWVNQTPYLDFVLMSDNKCYLGRSPAVTKGILILKPREFFFPISLGIAGGTLYAALPLHAQKTVQVSSKWGSSNAYLAPADDTSFRPYLA